MVRVNLFGKAIVLSSFLLLIFFFLGVLPSHADEYPTRPVKIILPFGPGGVQSVIWRSMADPMSKVLKQPVVIENKPGGGGNLALELTAKARPDGYTTGSAPIPALVNNFLAYDVSYDPFKSFTYIGGIWVYSEVLAVKSDSPWKTWAELSDYVKKHPNEVKIGYSNPSASAVVSNKFVAKKLGLVWREVTMNGEADLVPALLGGHIDAFIGAGVVHTLLADGRARGILAITRDPVPGRPEIPNVNKLYGIDAYNVCGLSGPAGLPEAVVKKLESALEEGTKSPEYRATIEKMGAIVKWQNSKEFTGEVKTIYEVQHEILKELNLLKKK
jgi:tripartite-type tricarboxylate transporter receptor subunit TctC